MRTRGIDFPDLTLVSLGTVLIIAGVLLALFVVVVYLARSAGLEARGRAVVIVGPFPIILGSDKKSARVLLVLSTILVGALIALFLLQAYF